MKELLYIDYPEITEIGAKVLHKRYEKDKTKLVLDRTIFFPGNDYLKKDQGSISDHKLLDLEEKNGKIVHIVEGKVEKTSLLLKIDPDIRFHNLYYNTAYLLLKMVFESLYNSTDTKINIFSNSAQMTVENFYLDFKKEEFEDYINKFIGLGLDIRKNQEQIFVDSLGYVKESELFFKKTSDIFGIHIYRASLISNSLILDFLTGKDLLAYNKANYKLLKQIQQISTSGDLPDEKIRKIISSIQNNKFL